MKKKEYFTDSSLDGGSGACDRMRGGKQQRPL